MRQIARQRIPLSTGVTLNVALAGPRNAPPVLLLHGFPESHRTWRNQIDDLSRDFFVVAPDQRGFAGSDRPEGVEQYETDKIIADAMALMDALDVRHFTLGGHDWGGAVAWAAALSHPLRVKRLVIVNAPHPLIFQKSLIDDEAQREASQYITYLRSPAAEAAIAAMGLEAFLGKLLLSHSDATKLPEEERQGLCRRLEAARRHHLDAELVPGDANRRPRTRRGGEGAALDPRPLPRAAHADPGGVGPQGSGAAPGPARRPRCAGQGSPPRHLADRRPLHHLGGTRHRDPRDRQFLEETEA
jgi:pimeloyl-ACP methyl ester carboxylesterase